LSTPADLEKGSRDKLIVEINITQDAILAQQEPDLTAMGQLAIRRDALIQRSGNIPIKLPALWAGLGSITKAEALALSITEPSRQLEAMAALLPAAAATGDVTRTSALCDATEATARGMTNELEQPQALLILAEAFATIGALDRAVAVARSIAPVTLQGQALATVRVAAARAGHDPLVRELTDDIERIIAAADPQTQASLLIEIVPQAAATSPDLARSWAKQAATAARSINDPYLQTLLLTNLVAAVVDLDLHDQACAWADWAETASRSIDDPELRVRASVLVATSAARVGLTDKARAALDGSATAAEPPHAWTGPQRSTTTIEIPHPSGLTDPSTKVTPTRRNDLGLSSSVSKPASGATVGGRRVVRLPPTARARTQLVDQYA
jgi:hypothetical protein